MGEAPPIDGNIQVAKLTQELRLQAFKIELKFLFKFKVDDLKRICKINRFKLKIKSNFG